MPEDVTFLREYRTRMDTACENLAMAYHVLGVEEPMDDHELVEFAARKLIMLHAMVLAAGVQPGVLAAAMKD